MHADRLKVVGRTATVFRQQVRLNAPDVLIGAFELLHIGVIRQQLLPDSEWHGTFLATCH